MGSGSRDLPAVGSTAKLALLELGSPFSSMGRTLVRLRKAEQYGLCLSLGLVEEGREPWSLSRSESYTIWFSTVPTLPFTSLVNGCGTVSLLDHPELDEGTSSKMSPRDEQGARVLKTSTRVNVISPRDEQGARVLKPSTRMNVISPRDEQGARVLKTFMRSIVLLSPVRVLRARHVYGDKLLRYKEECFVLAWTWMERIYRLLFMERNLFKHCHGFGAWGVMLCI
ncbi:unnamed protein product [Lepeophtheirus salmonis]|uniref:(salmon louse) hypothetical protein n=1 Tax=Lepeophtheirus salmonis TaxID=72036 RepID=A0A7R8D6N7_LEPSM|nr:unnamed protein product [Lepeophtheirus salmonis]CAF3017766.1 unnamed protein product [Lepeophtheirus salmonis]